MGFPDQEVIYRLIYERKWNALLDLVYQHRSSIEIDDLLAGAFETFTAVFFTELREVESAGYREELEKLFLLHTGHFYSLSNDQFEQVVDRLVNLSKEDSDTALGYARFCSHLPSCRAVIQAYGLTEQDRISHGLEEEIEWAERRPDGPEDFTTGLFKSRQEREFYLVACEVFDDHLVYPNVAIHSVVDYQAIRVLSDQPFL